MQEIGITDSVKETSTEVFEFLYHLCQRHPEVDSKFRLFADFQIRPDAMNKTALALFIVNTDGTLTEISWRVCVSGRGFSSNQEYNMALRHSVCSQILEFRKNVDTRTTICPLCSRSLADKFHADHVVHFAELVDNFTTTHNIVVPTTYDKVPVTFERTFIANDAWIGEAFYNYHSNHADLRAVCADCNLTREKYKKQEIPKTRESAPDLH